MGQRLILRAAAVASSSAMVAGCLVGAVAPASAAPESTSLPTAEAIRVSAAVESVGPIAVVPAAAGLVAPTGPVEVAVMPDGGVSSGARPFLAVPALMDQPGSVNARVVDASRSGDAEGVVVWSGELTDGWGRVDAALPAGGAYRVDASADGTTWHGVGWFVVRGAWASGGSDVSAGALSVSQVSGNATWGWASPALPGPVGAGSVSLGWAQGWAAPTSLRSALPSGVPAGWRIGLGTGSPWAAVLVSAADGIARVVGWDGSVLVFQRSSSDVWVQVTGGAPGFSNELRKVDSTTWEFVSAQGVTTRFGGADGVFRVKQVYSGGERLAQVAWDGGRVQSVTNEVGRTATLSYAGAQPCASSGWSGWAAVPTGMLCAVSYPDGTSTQFGYVSGVNGAAQIAMVKNPGDVATSLGWDSRGRLVSERGAYANRVALVDPAARSVMTQLSYDSTGRASSLRLSSGAMQRLTFPNVSEKVLKSWVKNRDKAEQVTVMSALTAGDYRLVKTSWLDPTSWVTFKSQDATGLQSRIELDDRGRVSKQIDGLGRVTTYKYNDLGLVVATTGPTAGDKGAQTGQDFDTTGVGTRERDLVGLRALVGVGADRLPEYWPATQARGGLSYSWSGRASGWAGQATGIWDPPADMQERAKAAGGWQLRVLGDGADLRVRIGTQVCEADATGACTVRAWNGDYTQVTVELTRGRERGFFQVMAAPRGGPLRDIGFDEVTPGYALVTQSSTNDLYPGRTKAPETVTAYDDPASGMPTQVTSPGGLVSHYTYEDGGWGRLIKATTAGGAVQTTQYWPDDAAATLPTVCGGQTVRVSGQMRSVTRQDGSIVRSWPNLSGNVVAEELSGPGGDTQTTCTDYFADGSLRTSKVFNAEGQLVEQSTTNPAVGGDYRVSRTTLTKGPGAGDVVLDEVWSTTKSNALGQVLEATGSSGVVTRSTYNALGKPVSVTETAADGTVLTRAYSYRPADGQLASVTINGVKAAAIAYDAYARVQSVSYAGGVQASYAYDSAGRGKSLTVTSGNATSGLTRWSHQRDLTTFGRVMGETLSRGGAADEKRTYTYDPGTGRLVRASIVSGAGADARTTVFGYGFDAASVACPASTYNAGLDGLRTSGTRNGVAYVTCYDDAGRVVSTTDPLVTGGSGTADVSYDGFGRVSSMNGDAPAAIEWGLGASMTSLDQGGEDSATITMEDFAGGTLLRTVTTATGTSSARYAGDFTLATDASGAPGKVIATQYGLPGGVQVRVSEGTATATFPDLTGAAMAKIAIPVLSGDTGSASISAADRFGPYGEPLSGTSGGDAVKDYTWRAGQGLETLPGSASITIMGARPYHPGLGLFLTPDPVIDGGDTLYSYTSGDPINYRDPSGGSEESSWGSWLAMVGGGIAALIASGAAVASFRVASVGGAKAAAWISGLAGAAAVAGGAYLAVTAGADSDQTLMIAGIVMAAVGAGAGATGAIKGFKRIGQLKAPAQQKVVAEVAPAPAQSEAISTTPAEPQWYKPRNMDEAEYLVRDAYEEVLADRGVLGQFEDQFLGMGTREATRVAKNESLLRGGLATQAAPGSRMHFYQQEYQRVSWEAMKTRIAAEIDLSEIL